MNKITRIGSCLFLLTFLLPLCTFAKFDFNANCLRAYDDIFSLKLNSARQLLALEKKNNPNNGIVVLLENYMDYFYLLTSDSKEEFDRLKDNKGIRLDVLDDEDETSPYYLYAQAEINLQWALIRGRYGEYFTAAREIKKANGALQENSRKFPGFPLNNKGLGLISAFLGNLPDGLLKNTLATFGIKGNVREGVSLLEKLVDKLPQSTYEPFYEEVVFYYAFVLNDIAHSPSAYIKTMKYTARIADSSLLKSYLQATVSAKSGHNDDAIAILSSRPSGNSYQAFPYLDFLLASAKLNKLDYAAAAQDFSKFLQQSKGVNYIKDANLRLAWIGLLRGSGGTYNGFIGKVKSAGYSYQEKDKQALSEANDGPPNRRLLMARLLFDGGYFSKAKEVISGDNIQDFSAGRDRTEYCYRLGRILEEMGKDEEALSSFQSAINQGRNLKYYYAANAALQAGGIFEKQKDFLKARNYYNAAIQMKNHDYESSIETQAKAALKRLTEGD